MEKIILAKNVTLNLIRTAKFKDVMIELRFYNELTNQRATSRALLALILQDRCAKYETKIKMNNALDDLYGASLSIRCFGYGKGAILRISLKAINQRFGDDQLLDRQFAFLHEIIFEPLLIQETFDEGKTALENELWRLQEDPREYISKLALETAGDGWPLAINTSGDLNVLDQTDLAELVNEYQTMLKEDQITINVIGDVSEEIIVSQCQRYLDFKPRLKQYGSYYEVKGSSVIKKEIERQIEQTSLMLVYNTNTAIVDPLYWPLKLGTIILGQLPISLLFIEVREKRSLCYNISSSLLSFDGVMIIYTGIDYQNVAQTLQLIEQELSNVITGNYSETLLHAAKEMLINSLRSTADNPAAILNFNYQNQLIDTDLTIDQLIEKLSTVSIDEISSAFQRLKLNTTFILKKKDVQNAENN
ncbi:MAG: pitrilysin family protein [Erysipelotrichaceae bacterium]|nr:pitrilysin family protein [Erysipelotrichaceae bacterium]